MLRLTLLAWVLGGIAMVLIAQALHIVNPTLTGRRCSLAAWLLLIATLLIGLCWKVLP